MSPSQTRGRLKNMKNKQKMTPNEPQLSPQNDQGFFDEPKEKRSSITRLFDDATLGITKEERRNNVKWHIFISMVLSVVLAYLIIAAFDIYMLKKEIVKREVIMDHLPFISEFKVGQI